MRELLKVVRRASLQTQKQRGKGAVGGARNVRSLIGPRGLNGQKGTGLEAKWKQATTSNQEPQPISGINRAVMAVSGSI